MKPPTQFKICRFQPETNAPPHWGLLTADNRIGDLTAGGGPDLETLLESEHPLEVIRPYYPASLPEHELSRVRLLAPVQQQEVWAAGVTYLRSKHARMEESDFSANAYDRVYDAERPELFFKALPEKVVGPDDTLGIRRDSRWNVPEPELALAIDSRGRIAGFTVGNDVSSRDIEGENLLYLPQAKVYSRSCALGPWIVLGADEAQARAWSIRLEIRRDGTRQFAGETGVNQIKRSFAGLVDFLFRSQEFPHGVILLTGTGIVPPPDFTLAPGDEVAIEISGIGTLRNKVIQV